MTSKWHTRRFFVGFSIIIILMALAACTAGSEPATSKPEEPAPAEAAAAEVSQTESPPVEPTAVPTTEPPSPTTEPPTATAVPSATPAATATPAPTEEPTLAPLPAEPQTITFEAEDSQVLQGVYYPAAVNPAPIIVLMHWAPGDQNDWPEIARWLQNRGTGGDTSNPEGVPWLDSSWFPEMPEGRSFAVFTFTFRQCDGGCADFVPEGWLLDAQAAMETAMGLEGVDPTQMVAIGASIGSDGAADGCYLFNEKYENRCLGAFSLSPGSYLTVDYAAAVDALGGEQPPKPAWCLFAEGDGAAATACNSASGDHYRSQPYGGNAHGMELVDPDVEPNVLGLMLEFLELTLGP